MSAKMDRLTTWTLFENRPRSGQITLDFGAATGTENDSTSVTVAAAWVKTDSIILLQVPQDAMADHDPEDALFEELQLKPMNIIAGVSFDIVGYAPHGTWGRYRVVYQGLRTRSAT